MIWRTPFALALVAACLTPIAAPAQPPSIGYTDPLAVAPGKATDITLRGAALAAPTGVWCSFGGQIEVAPGIEGNGTKADQVTYRVTLPADIAPQVGAIRVATGQGISSLRLVMIDDLPTVADNGQNKSVETAQELTLPVAVDGASEAESFDFYKLNAHAGQRISIEVFSRRLGFPLDPVVRVLNSAGKELAYSDDEGGSGADCRLTHQFDADGAYLIEVRDIRYQGGGGHRYRMRVGDFPLVTTPVPLAARQGTTALVSAAGQAIERAPRVTVSVPSAPPGGQIAVGFRYPDGAGSSFGTLVASQASEQIEFEPNDAAEQSSTLSLPGAVSGRFLAPKDRDFYQFDVAAGQRWVFAGRTRQLGSPTDLYLRLYKADGALLAEADDNGADEGQINHTFAEAGTYRLMVEDLHHRGGADQSYRIEATPYQPGFALSVEGDKFDVPQGGVFVAKVTATRFDYNGPITLSLENGDGIALANNVIPEGKNEVVIQATAGAGLEPGHWRTVAVAGHAKIGDKDFSARAENTAALKGLFSGFPYPPEPLVGSLGIGVGPVFPDFFKLSVAEGAIRLPQLVGTATFTVKAEKLNGFNDAIALSVEGLPPEITADVKPIEKDKAEQQITLKGPASLVEGEMRIRLVGTAAHQNQPKRVVLDQIPLRVTPPLVVTVELSGAVKAGDKLKAKVRAARDGGATEAIALEWKNLPLGVTAPTGVTIPAGQNELDLELATAANSMVGAVENVLVIASTKVQGRDIAVESAPAKLEVTMP